MLKHTYLLFSLGLLLSCGKAVQRPVRFVPLELYDVQQVKDTDAIDGFKQTILFSDEFGPEVWVSPETACVKMERVTSPVAEGTAAIHLKWDKVTGGCKWIGIGMGWNDWQAKDMTGIVDISAVQLRIRSVKGSFSNLPVAFAFEDYTGVQSYCGFNRKYAPANFNDREWTTLTIPLRDFPFYRNGADMSKVKQFMIQLEGESDVYIDDIRLIKIPL